jgi:hypothetical protein
MLFIIAHDQSGLERGVRRFPICTELALGRLDGYLKTGG